LFEIFDTNRIELRLSVQGCALMEVISPVKFKNIKEQK